MLKALMRVRLASLKSWFFGGTRKKKITRGRLIGMSALMLYAFCAIGFLLYSSFVQLATAYRQMGLEWLYFAMFFLLDFGLIFIGSVFTAKAQLFEARDNELLSSMPIPPGYILTSRMLLLWALGLFYGLLAAIPAGLAWCASGPVTAAGLAAFIVIVLLLPAFSLAVSSLLAWLIACAAARTHRKVLLSVVLSLVFLGAYFVVVSRLNSIVSELALRGEQIAQGMGKILPLYWAGLAMGEGSLPHLLGMVLLLTLPLALVWWLLSRNLMQDHCQTEGGRPDPIPGRRQKQSALPALLRREKDRSSPSAAYVLNGGLGAVFSILGGAALVVFSGRVREFVSLLPGMEAYAVPLLIACSCMLASMILVSSASVSIEGVSLWIIQSMPVETKSILQAKALLHILISAPGVLAIWIGTLTVLRPGLDGMALALLIPAAFTVLCSLVGLHANLRHPSLDWVNETQAVKSGVSVFLGMFIPWGILIALGAVYAFLVQSLWLALLLLALGDWLLYRGLLRKGCLLFQEL